MFGVVKGFDESFGEVENDCVLFMYLGFVEELVKGYGFVGVGCVD